MDWWLDKVRGEGGKILPKYQEAMRQLKLEITVSLLRKMATSAQKMRSVCLDRDGIAVLVTAETLFYIMVYALTGEESKAAAVSIALSAKESGCAISSETQRLGNCEVCPRDGGSENRIVVRL